MTKSFHHRKGQIFIKGIASERGSTLNFYYVIENNKSTEVDDVDVLEKSSSNPQTHFTSSKK